MTGRPPHRRRARLLLPQPPRREPVRRCTRTAARRGPSSHDQSSATNRSRHRERVGQRPEVPVHGRSLGWAVFMETRRSTAPDIAGRVTGRGLLSATLRMAHGRLELGWLAPDDSRHGRVLGVGGLVVVVVIRGQLPPPNTPKTWNGSLAQRFAAGEIGEDEYRRRLDALREVAKASYGFAAPPPQRPPDAPRPNLVAVTAPRLAAAFDNRPAAEGSAGVYSSSAELCLRAWRPPWWVSNGSEVSTRSPGWGRRSRTAHGGGSWCDSSTDRPTRPSSPISGHGSSQRVEPSGVLARLRLGHRRTRRPLRSLPGRPP